jgi:hypothetical protein
MAEPRLDWNTAAVEESRLTVELEGELDSDWKKAFTRTLTLLDSGTWGEIKLQKSSVHAAEVEPGTEEKLRHLLESVVEQANADQRDDETERDEKPKDDHEGADQERGEDADMTGRFRSFGTDEHPSAD